MMIKFKKTKKAKINKLPDIHKEIRNFGVIIESVDSKVGLIAEQYGDIKQTLDSHTGMIGKLVVDTAIIKETLNSHKETLDSHTEMISKLAVDTAIIKEDIELIKNGLKKKIDIEEFTALEKRVALLERHR